MLIAKDLQTLVSRRTKIGADVQASAQRLLDSGKLTPLQKQLLGLEQLYSERRASPMAVDGEWQSRVPLH